jgi:hypothetical protein
MITVRCKVCGTELTSCSKVQVCGCSNRMEVCGDKISALDLSNVIMVGSDKKEKTNVLSAQDLSFQEERRKRKIRKLDFEVR